jgi:hypothetical protein
LLSCGVAQDVAHAGDRTCVLRPRQRLGRGQLIAGFEVSINCRFSVSTEVVTIHGNIWNAWESSDLDNRKAMKGSATRGILELIAELESEGLL